MYCTYNCTVHTYTDTLTHVYTPYVCMYVCAFQKKIEETCTYTPSVFRLIILLLEGNPQSKVRDRSTIMYCTDMDPQSYICIIT